MTATSRIVAAPVAVAALAWLATWLAGCDTGRYGSDLVGQPAARKISAGDASTLRLPADQPFSLAKPASRREPRLDGRAEADATADRAGTASARAEVVEGGVAEGTFQVGQAIANDTGRQCDFEFSVNCRYSLELSSSGERPLPDAVVGLRLYARTSRGRLLRELPIVDQTTEHGAARRSGGEAMHFTVTLPPAESVTVFVAGQARVDVPDGRSAQARLTLDELTYEVTSRPAPELPAPQPAQP